MHQLELARLKDAKICQNEHRFGTAATAYKTIAAVRVPFMFDSPHETSCVEFYITFDVIEGDLSYLIELPRLRAMKAMLSFRYENTSLVVDRATCRLGLVKCNSHLCLPLRGRCTYRRLFQHHRGPSSQCTYRGFGTGHDNPYYTPVETVSSSSSQIMYVSNEEESSSVLPAAYLPIKQPSNVWEPEIQESVTAFTNHKLRKIHIQLDHGTLSQMQSS